MDTRMRIAKVGAGVWLFAAFVAIIAYLVPQAVLDGVPMLVTGALDFLAGIAG